MNNFTPELRELYKRLERAEEIIKGSSVLDTAENIVPPMINFVDNSDFIFSNEAYNASSFTDDEDVLAQWYGRPQGTSSAYTENTASESSLSIRSSAHGSGARTGFEWKTDTGTIALTGGYQLGSRLASKYATAGNYMICRLQVIRNTGATIADSLKLKVSIWDNTDRQILRGTTPELASTKIGGHSGGSVTRQYILEIQMPDGKRFFTDTTTFTDPKNEITNTVATTSVDNNDYVSVALPNIVGAVRYSLYRRTPLETDTNWYLVDTVPKGTGTILDFGGGNITWTVPTLDNDNKEFALAEAFLDDISGEIPSENVPYEVIIPIIVPSTFIVNGDQFLQIEFLREDYTDTDSTDISADGILIDKVGLSYTNGRWVASARDQTKLATPTTPTNPVPTGGGGGINPDVPVCIWVESNVLMWSDDRNHYLMPASSVIVGDRLVSWNGTNFVPSRVRKIVKGISRFNYKLFADDKEVICSFSHRVISHFNDFEKGTRVGDLDRHTLTYDNNSLKKSRIIGLETFHQVIDVVTFKMEKNLENYIAEGFVHHNSKPAS